MTDPFRASFRRYVRLDCQVVREHDFNLVGDLVLDLSTTGMLVRAKRRVLTGEEVVVSFKPPKSNQYFDAEGVVSRVVHGRRPGDCGLAFGVAFYTLGAESMQRLFDQLKGLSAPDAQRPLRPLALTS